MKNCTKLKFNEIGKVVNTSCVNGMSINDIAIDGRAQFTATTYNLLDFTNVGDTSIFTYHQNGTLTFINSNSFKFTRDSSCTFSAYFDCAVAVPKPGMYTLAFTEGLVYTESSASSIYNLLYAFDGKPPSDNNATALYGARIATENNSSTPVVVTIPIKSGVLGFRVYTNTSDSMPANTECTLTFNGPHIYESFVNENLFTAFFEVERSYKIDFYAINSVAVDKMASGNSSFAVWSTMYPAGQYIFSAKAIYNNQVGTVRLLISEQVEDSVWNDTYQMYFTDISQSTNQLVFTTNNPFKIGVAMLGPQDTYGRIYEMFLGTSNRMGSFTAYGEPIMPFTPYVENGSSATVYLLTGNNIIRPLTSGTNYTVSEDGYTITRTDMTKTVEISYTQNDIPVVLSRGSMLTFSSTPDVFADGISVRFNQGGKQTVAPAVMQGDRAVAQIEVPTDMVWWQLYIGVNNTVTKVLADIMVSVDGDTVFAPFSARTQPIIIGEQFTVEANDSPQSLIVLNAQGTSALGVHLDGIYDAKIDDLVAKPKSVYDFFLGGAYPLSMFNDDGLLRYETDTGVYILDREYNYLIGSAEPIGNPQYRRILPIYNAYSLKQNLECRCQTIRGELAYNTQLGIPLKTTADEKRLAVLNLINTTPGVEECVLLDSYIQDKTLYMNVRVQSNFGTFVLSVSV